MTSLDGEAFPALPYSAWHDTYATLHMWTQIVGKVALALAPPVNHSWAIAMHVTSRGLATPRLPYGRHSLTMELDFIDHQLVFRASHSQTRVVRLEPRSVADFYRDVMRVLRELGPGVRIWPMPVEVPSPIRFDTDTIHAAYDATFANRCWRILASVDNVLTRSRCRFVGKASPTHFFWGGFDLAATRFSGRPAPPREGPAFMREAYSHEVISHGFWPGSAPLLEPAFYAYAAPEPAGLQQATVEPAAAYYHEDLKEFILPYEAVRTASSPEDDLLRFVESTYAQAANLGHWDRAALERAPATGGRR